MNKFSKVMPFPSGVCLVDQKSNDKVCWNFLFFLVKYAPDIYLPSHSSSNKVVPPGRAVELYFQTDFFLFCNQYEKYEKFSINLTDY